MNNNKIQDIKNLNNNSINLLSKTDIEQFNSFKYKHFNNFFYNLLNEQLKNIQINNLSNGLDNHLNPNSKNDLLNKVLKKNIFLNSKSNFKNINNNKQKLELPFNNNAFNLKPSKSIKTYEKIYLNNFSENKNNSSYLNKKQNKALPNINPKYKNAEQNTIPNIVLEQNENPKFKNNSRNKRNISMIQNENINKSFNEENEKYYKTSDYSTTFYKSKIQQLPKDAVNNLLLFLKKNKKHLARTSKYYNIYKDYKELIDNEGENSSVFESKNTRKYNNKNIIGYYGRKPLDGVEIYDVTSTYGCNFKNRSEKSRLDLIFGELNKLKGYIEKNKNEKDLFINDFLNKHNIKFTNKNQLNCFENFIKNFNKNNFINLLKPSLGIKGMILNVIERENHLNINNKNIDNKKINNSLSTQNINHLNTFNNSYNNQFKTYESNINQYPILLKENYLISYNNKNINNNNDILYPKIEEENNKKNKTNKVHSNDKTKTKNFDLYDTNSYLKHIEKQSKIHYPTKNYSSNNKLIIEEIGGELNKLDMKIKKEKKYKYKLEKSFNPNKNKKIYKKENKNFNFITQKLNKSIDDIFITTSNNTSSPNNKTIQQKKSIENINLNKGKNQNMKIFKKSKNEKDCSDTINRKNRKKITRIIINKLNLKPKLNEIEIEDVKKRLKLTEYIVYNNARRKLMFEEIGKNELYECVNNINNNKI